MSTLAADSALLHAEQLSVGFAGCPTLTLDGFDLALQAGVAVGLVGASGSGKSLAARALLGLLPAGATVRGGTLRFRGESLRSQPDFERVRGRHIAYVFQDAAASLHPLVRVGRQLSECVRVHAAGATTAARRERVEAALRDVGLEPDPRIFKAYPQQLSGGQRQRVMLALTLIPGPQVLIADEPTSALDPVLARRVCALLADLVRRRGLALLLISHDLPRVAEICQTVHVLDQGRVVESGPAQELLLHPRSAAAQRLSAALRDPVAPAIVAAAGAPVLEAQALSVRYAAAWRWPWQPRPAPALTAVDARLLPGQRLGVIGGSGSGKSTLARALIGLLPPAAGQVRWFGSDFACLSAARQRSLRPRVQMVFQDPLTSLDPMQRIDQMLDQALARAGTSPPAERRQRAQALLLAVGLDAQALPRYPNQFSGGQRQRLAIARALATDPAILICDEATSALDSATQNQILDLLDRLARERGIALVFIAHDLLAVARLCQTLVVLEHGRIVESGNAREHIAAPQSRALRELVEALPASLRERYA